MIDPRERVIAERRMRGESARTASGRGGISNTTWSAYEKGGELTPKVRAAITQSFKWPADWVERPPKLPADAAVAELRGRLARLEHLPGLVEELARRVAEQGDQIAKLTRRIDQGEIE